MKIILEDIVYEVKRGINTNIDTLIGELTPLILSMIKKYGYYENFDENYQNSMVVLLESIKEYDSIKNVTFAAFYKLNLFYFFVNEVKAQTDERNYTQETLSVTELSEGNYFFKDQHLEDLIWQEYRTTLHEAINQLSKRQKWIINQHYFKGKTLIAISKQYGLHQQSLVKLKARALSMLKIFLEQKYIN